MKFLINPREGDMEAGMAKRRRMPPRHRSGPKKGQFMSKRARSARKSGRKRKSNAQGRRVTTTRAAAPRKRARANPKRRRAAPRKRPRARRNPRRVNIMNVLLDGTVEAGQILVGKAAVRTIPDLAGFSKEGNMGLAIQTGTALAIGFVAEMFLSKAAARALTAGALTAPLETLIVAYKVPWLAGALAPVTAQGSLSSYMQPPGTPVMHAATGVGMHAGMGRYVQPNASGGGMPAANYYEA